MVVDLDEGRFEPAVSLLAFCCHFARAQLVSRCVRFLHVWAAHSIAWFIVVCSSSIEYE